MGSGYMQCDIVADCDQTAELVKMVTPLYTPFIIYHVVLCSLYVQY